jgi:hypothetical protein
VIAELPLDHRCVAPNPPIGAFRPPIGERADLSLPGIARLVAELTARLELEDVTRMRNTQAARSWSCSSAGGSGGPRWSPATLSGTSRRA